MHVNYPIKSHGINAANDNTKSGRNDPGVKPDVFTERSHPDAARFFRSPEQMSLYASRYMTEHVSETLRKRNRCFIGFSGGKTPIRCYRRFAYRLRKILSPDLLRHIHCFLGDERMVPACDPDSNTKMIMANFVLLMPENTVEFHAPNTGLANPESVAADYENRIMQMLPVINQTPRFDLIMLGLGTDGHTASIFSDTLHEHAESRRVLPVQKAGGRIHERITLNLEVINAAEQVLFLVSGKEKKPVLQQVLLKNPVYPASHIETVRGSILFFMSE